jgi:UTP--glucose-1-phosphate uridylyltransferase
MAKPVKKAIFPVGGLGTRFLPATKAMPKEMLPVVDKPLIQYAVEEAKAAGIDQIIFVTGRGKSAIEDHFDYSYELNQTLLPRPGEVAYVRQQEPMGLGHAVWCARHLVGDEPVAILLADDLVKAKQPCLKQMLDLYETLGGNLVAAMEVPADQTNRYGIIKPGQDKGQVVEVVGLVEKPDPKHAPSRLAVIGRYILQPEIFRHLEAQSPGAGGEIQLTDAMAKMTGRGAFHAFRFEGRRFDCGDKTGFIEATMAFALDHPEIGQKVRRALRDLSSTLVD